MTGKVEQAFRNALVPLIAKTQIYHGLSIDRKQLECLTREAYAVFVNQLKVQENINI